MDNIAPTWQTIVSILTALGLVATVVERYITNRRAGRQQERDSITNGAAKVTQAWDSLCEDLQMQITELRKRQEANEAEIARLRQELVEARAEGETLRGKLAFAEDRIAQLEAENAILTAKITELEHSGKAGC